MRLTTLLVLVTASLAAACLGETGHRKPGSATSGEGSGSDSDGTSGESCARVEGDFVIRAAADMAKLPRTGCYDIYGKLTLQGTAITSLAGLNEINSVDELDLDHTGLTSIDTRRPLGIYGKLTVTGNARLTKLAQLSFEAAATGILIDGNPVLATLEPLALDEPALDQVDGDVVITANPALTRVPLGHLTRLSGGLTVQSNAALTAIDLGKLTTTGSVEIADNTKLTSLTFAATTITGDLAVRNNPALTGLGTMTALYRVTGNVTIDGNAALTSLAAFTTSLQFIDLALTITHNPALTDLGALKHLQLVGGIAITNNQNLVICRAIEIDRCVAHPTTAVISNNKDGSCNWQCD